MGVNRSVIRVKNLTKVFRIPHIRHNDLKTYLINLRQARKYDDFYALKNINLAINRGEFVGIIGRNGSGKSTLLKLMTGILHPTSGEVIVKESISPFLELGVGFNPELTARENIFLYCSILGLSRQESLQSYPKVLEFSACLFSGYSSSISDLNGG
jgi:lipopolysaccharide transport system ATP-binding protein